VSIHAATTDAVCPTNASEHKIAGRLLELAGHFVVNSRTPTGRLSAAGSVLDVVKVIVVREEWLITVHLWQ
jgi:hypothetical protein